MKKTVLLNCIVGLSLAMFVAGCASTSKTEAAPQQSKVPVQKTVSRETIDWKGAGLGAEIPGWAVAATEDDFEGLSADLRKRLDGKFYIFISTERVRKNTDSTKDLKMAQEAAAANYMVTIARSLNAAVDARFSGVLSANEDTQKTLVATAANARFSGFSRIADTWVLQRVTDSKTNQVTDTYTIVQIYACDQALWQEQAANYIREFANKNPDSDDMKKAAAMADDIAASIKPGRISSN
ncbi:hypothetical protein [Treponema sp.]|uniref:hypothetical protein n=1 Tax=Treponema sp. TaxID=166 RepID=UPI003EFEDDE2